MQCNSSSANGPTFCSIFPRHTRNYLGAKTSGMSGHSLRKVAWIRVAMRPLSTRTLCVNLHRGGGWKMVPITFPSRCVWALAKYDCTEWMSHRKQKETKQQPGTAGPGNIFGCCLVSLSFLCDIHSTNPVTKRLMKRAGWKCYGLSATRCL